MLSRAELEFLKSIEKGSSIKPEDQQRVRRLAASGFVRLGIDVDPDKDTIRQTAKPSEFGQRLLDLHRHKQAARHSWAQRFWDFFLPA